MAHIQWRYNINGGEGKLFQEGIEFDELVWLDTPAKCFVEPKVEDDGIMELEIVLSRDELKAKAEELGIVFPNNVKTEKLKELIEAHNATI